MIISLNDTTIQNDLVFIKNATDAEVLDTSRLICYVNCFFYPFQKGLRSSKRETGIES